MKKNYFIIVLAVTLLLITGCTGGNQETNNKEQTQKQTQEQPQEQRVGENQRPGWNDNFLEASQEDLVVGQRVLVMGSENTDGSIAANQIMIVDEETDFSQLGRGMHSQQANGSDDTPSQMPRMPEGERPNFEQMQNMSEEERMKFMEEMRAQREVSGIARPSMESGSAVRLNGEIIDKDDMSITLKLEISGSRLVFFSEETNILKIKDQIQ